MPDLPGHGRARWVHLLQSRGAVGNAAVVLAQQVVDPNQKGGGVFVLILFVVGLIAWARRGK